MGTAARKARKRAGIKFERKEKTPTPPEERSYVTEPVPGASGTLWAGYSKPRSQKKVRAYLNNFDKPE